MYHSNTLPPLETVDWRVRAEITKQVNVSFKILYVVNNLIQNTKQYYIGTQRWITIIFGLFNKYSKLINRVHA